MSTLAAAHPLGPVEVSVAALVVAGLVVLAGLLLIAGLLWVEYQDECAHRRRMARARRRQHG